MKPIQIKPIVVIPAKLESGKLSDEKYYGVFLKGFTPSCYARSQVGIITRQNYSHDREYRVIGFNCITKGNNWESLEKLSTDYPKANLEQFVIKLDEAGFSVVEFDTIPEFANWLSHAGETL